MPDTSERYTLLKSMHTIVCLMNDESAYMRWINIIPDCVSDDELRDCASDDEIMLSIDGLAEYIAVSVFAKPSNASAAALRSVMQASISLI